MVYVYKIVMKIISNEVLMVLNFIFFILDNAVF